MLGSLTRYLSGKYPKDQVQYGKEITSQIANKANLTPEELDHQERCGMFIQDQRGALTKAYEEGFKRGLREGHE